jgi:steroid delta-isomerase-like uncharacterized protein
MSDANKQLVQRWFDEVWNQGSPATIHELFHSDGIAHGFPEPSAILTGPSEFTQAHALFKDAFSNIKVHVDETIAEGDNVAARWTATITHTGQALGFPPTGRTSTFSGTSFLHIADGKIAEAWNHMDFTRVVLELQAASVATKR